MRLQLGVFILIISMSNISCTNNPELDSKMTDSKNLKAVDETLGLTQSGDRLIFRVYAPAVSDLEIVFFDSQASTTGESHLMNKKKNGVWEFQMEASHAAPFYAYRRQSAPKQIIADPYSRAVVRQNNYHYPSKSVILPPENYDWEGDTFTHAALGDLVILESHLRDMTVHPSSGTKQVGTYRGFVESDQRGGIQHLKDLGVNAVEFLPLQEFGNIEIDYKNPDLGVWNDWNAYENNHWGYMTSFFFAPEIYYASDGIRDRGAWLGEDGRAVNEMKEMVKILHQQGISVIMDVVYNHVSQYDENPFKLIDKAVYFRLDEKGNYIAASGCGNDFQTEHPMARKMIVESLVYWMEEYHIDGFRFDLAAMIDLETVDAITEATQKINPDVLLIAEPWGGGAYNPAELADHGWASWNDRFRNGIKGRNPRADDTGFIFGKLWDGNTKEYFKSLMTGYLQPEGGHYRHPVQSVNYLESHDDNTMGDYIRLATGKIGREQVVTREQVARLSPEELRLHKFAALNLMVSQGPVMMAQGQSWGRAKVIANSIGSDPHAGMLDHNSYEKDDETNWLNWDEKALNKDLVDYYKGLIAIRNRSAELRNVEEGFRSFIESKDKLSFGFQMSADQKIIVFLNANPKTTVKYTLPAGEWMILADASSASPEGVGAASKSIAVAPRSGVILVQ
ncbi:MAG: pullulanase [Candidatus Marinimicrobia bacterium]|nr:pullulanase [Candidatus Neomarinimicrobiota bacterium]